MIGFLLYCATAAAVLFGYGFLEFIGPLASGRPPVASLASAAAPGAALLFFAGLLNLWKPRAAGFIALAGALLIWSVLFSPMQMGAFFYFLSLLVIGYVIPVLITVILVGCSTVYAGIAVIGSERFAALLAWLFPERPVDHPVGKSHIQPPTAVRSAAVLLYSWLALVVVSVIQEYWRNGQMRQARGPRRLSVDPRFHDHFRHAMDHCPNIEREKLGADYFASYVRADSSRDDYGFGSA
jgi:hypothetical protein